MDAGITISQEQLQKLSINQIQSLHILSLSAESLRDLLQKESEENPFMDYRSRYKASKIPISCLYLTGDSHVLH